MRQERSQALQAQPYERTETRQGQANGFKPKTVATRVGAIQFRVPQVRGDFGLLSPGPRKGHPQANKPSKLALAEMDVQGVSTCKVSAIVEELCGHFRRASTQVSQCAARLDTQLLAWRERQPWARFPTCSWMPATKKSATASNSLDCAILIALGVRPDGKRSILGVSVALSEAEKLPLAAISRTASQGRGLHGLQLIVSDDHSQAGAARRAVFPAVPWQALPVPSPKKRPGLRPLAARLDQRASAVADAIRSVFNCTQPPRRRTASSRKSSRPMPCPPRRLVRLARKQFAPRASPRLRAAPRPPAAASLTSNPLERVNQEIKRRTRVARLFPNEASLLRLVTALLNEISDDWQTGKIYLNMENPTQPSV